MSYVGNEYSVLNSITDTFSGNGSLTEFSLSKAPETVNDLIVFVGGDYINTNDYSVSGSTLTFDTAPASGTNNVQVRQFYSTV